MLILCLQQSFWLFRLLSVYWQGIRAESNILENTFAAYQSETHCAKRVIKKDEQTARIKYLFVISYILTIIMVLLL